MQVDEQEIRQLVAAWMAATKAGDFEAVLGLMAEDVVFLVAGQAPMIGKSAFAAAAKVQPGKEPPRFDGASEVREVKVLGDWAYMWTRLSVVITPAGAAAPTERAGNTLSILRRQAGGWVIARDANMLSVVSK